MDAEAGGCAGEPSEVEAGAAIAAQIAARIAGLDLVAEFEAEGSAYSELDEKGEVVTRYPPARPSDPTTPCSSG